MVRNKKGDIPGLIPSLLVLCLLAHPSYGQESKIFSDSYLVRDIYEGPPSSHPGQLLALDGLLNFAAHIELEGQEIWVTDGTHMVKEINPEDKGSALRNLRVVGDQLFFSATHTNYVVELWVSDGTKEGTRMVKDIKDFGDGFFGSWPQNFAQLDDILYFSAHDGVTGDRVSISGGELWRSDGRR